MNDEETNSPKPSSELLTLLWRELELVEQHNAFLEERAQITKGIRGFPQGEVEAAAEGISARLEQKPWREALAEFRRSER